ncbi:MAG: CapA family protein [Clostridiales bacterium]|nr:CapA family protein [Clostridiales bacterium]
MEERYDRPRRSQRNRGKRRRLRPGFVLDAVCLVIILICFCIGGVQAILDHNETKAQEEAEAAALAEQEEAAQKAEEEAAALSETEYDFTIALMGDVNLDDTWYNMTYLVEQENGIYDCIGESLLERMQSADLFCVNSEFAFTDGGTALNGKAYTFRAQTSNISIYETMGVDLVTLANNHVYDYDAEGLTDTLATLDDAGIAHVGAGENLEEACEPYYVEFNGYTVAFVNASCAENIRYTPQATEDSAGILLCYETDTFVQVIQNAKENADFVIACVHWGTEYSYEANDTQRTTAKEYIDAGADVIVGTHSHCLQGIEYYDGKPIFYNLGTCWFNEKTLDTFLLEIHFTGNAEEEDVTFTVTPAIQSGCVTRLTESDEEWNQVVDLMEAYSYDVTIGSDGTVYPSDEAPVADADDGTDDETEAETETGTEDGTTDGDATADDTADETMDETGSDSTADDETAAG